MAVFSYGARLFFRWRQEENLSECLRSGKVIDRIEADCAGGNIHVYYCWSGKSRKRVSEYET